MLFKMTAPWSQFGYSRLARTALSSLIATVGIAPVAASAQAPTPRVTAQKGTGWVAAGIQRRLDTIPRITQQEIALQPQPLAPLHVDRLALAARKAHAARSRGTPPLGAMSVPPVFPQHAPFNVEKNVRLTPTSALTIISMGEGGCGTAHAADQALAVGDTTIGVLQAINACVIVFDKNGVQQPGYPKSFPSFLGIPSSSLTSDPRALYDWINHRYVLSLIQFDSNFNSASSYWIAVSMGDDPTGAYCLYNFPVQSVSPNGPGTYPLPDFPRLGQDRQAVYLASNISNPGFKWEELLILPKSLMYTCSSFTVTYFFNLNVGGIPTDSTQPANMFSPRDDPRSAYLVTSENRLFSDPKNGLAVWTIHNPLNSPTITGIVVPTANNYSTPPQASQPTSPNSIETFDSRITGMVFYIAGSLYASLTTDGGGGQPACLLYQIQPFVNSSDGSIASARVLNEIFFGGGTNSWYYCTQQPDPEGNVTTVYNFSSPSTYASLGYVSRRSGQPTGSLPDGGIILLSGSGPAYTQGRWGDYTAVAPAGLISGGDTGSVPVMWFAGMYGTGDAWGTTIGKNGYISNAQP